MDLSAAMGQGKAKPLRFPQEWKERVVELTWEDDLAESAKKLGISTKNLKQWRKNHAPDDPLTEEDFSGKELEEYRAQKEQDIQNLKAELDRIKLIMSHV